MLTRSMTSLLENNTKITLLNNTPPINKKKQNLFVKRLTKLFGLYYNARKRRN